MKENCRLYVIAVHLKAKIKGKICRSDIIGYRLFDKATGMWKDVARQPVDSLAVESGSKEVNVLNDINNYTRLYKGKIIGSEKLVIIKSGAIYRVISSDGACKECTEAELTEFVRDGKSLTANTEISVSKGQLRLAYHKLLEEADKTDRNTLEKRYLPLRVTVKMQKAGEESDSYTMMNGIFYDMDTKKKINWSIIKQYENKVDEWKRMEIDKASFEIKGAEYIVYQVDKRCIKTYGNEHAFYRINAGKYFILHENEGSCGSEFTAYQFGGIKKDGSIQTLSLEGIARSVYYKDREAVYGAEINRGMLSIQMLTGEQRCYSIEGLDLTRNAFSEKAEADNTKKKMLGIDGRLKVDANGNVYEIHLDKGEEIEIPSEAAGIEANSLFSNGKYFKEYGTLRVGKGVHINGALAASGEIECIYLNDREQYKDIIPTLKNCTVKYVHVNSDIDAKTVVEYLKSASSNNGSGWLYIEEGASEELISSAYAELLKACTKEMKALKPYTEWHTQYRSIGDIKDLRILYHLFRIAKEDRQQLKEIADFEGCQIACYSPDFINLKFDVCIHMFSGMMKLLKTDTGYSNYVNRLSEIREQMLNKYRNAVLKPVKKIGSGYGRTDDMLVLKSLDVYSTNIDDLYIIYNTGNNIDVSMEILKERKNRMVDTDVMYTNAIVVDKRLANRVISKAR